MSQRIHLYLSLALGLLLTLSAASGLVLSASVLSGHLQAPASDTQSVGQVAERLARSEALETGSRLRLDLHEMWDFDD